MEHSNMAKGRRNRHGVSMANHIRACFGCDFHLNKDLFSGRTVDVGLRVTANCFQPPVWRGYSKQTPRVADYLYLDICTQYDP